MKRKSKKDIQLISTIGMYLTKEVLIKNSQRIGRVISVKGWNETESMLEVCCGKDITDTELLKPGEVSLIVRGDDFKDDTQVVIPISDRIIQPRIKAMQFEMSQKIAANSDFTHTPLFGIEQVELF